MGSSVNRIQALTGDGCIATGAFGSVRFFMAAALAIYLLSGDLAWIPRSQPRELGLTESRGRAKSFADRQSHVTKDDRNDFVSSALRADLSISSVGWKVPVQPAIRASP